jgi:predicted dienelactone hydrolase
VVGASHLSVVDPSLTPYQQGKLPILNKEVTGKQAQDVRKFLKGITLAMAAQLTPEASQYAPFLTSDYAQISSTRLFPLRIVRELSPEMIQEAQGPGMTANK